MSNRTEELLDKAIRLVGKNPLNDREVSHIESRLAIIIPKDFKRLCSECSYEYFSFSDFHNFGMENQHSVIGETEAFRENANLPHSYLILHEDDSGLILLKTSSDPEGEAEVIWCSIYDLDNIINSKPLQYNPTIFPTFTDFFEYLVTEEEKERQLSSFQTS